MPTAHVLAASGVTKSFGEFKALRGLDLTIAPGECIGLLGPNGAGKSTFIGTLFGTVRRDAGTLTVFGMDPLVDARAIKRRLGVVPQENALDEGLSVLENMRLYAAFVEVPREKRDPRIRELLAYMQLDHKETAMIRTLSGGMKRRLAFVRALLSEPEFLILDEPTTGLDPAVRHLLWGKVEDLRRQNKTVLLSTHYMHEAEALCDRIVILKQGQVVDAGSPKGLIEKHAPGFVASFRELDSAALEAKIRAKMDSAWTLYRQRDDWCLRGPQLDALIAFQREAGMQALQMRPSNLEDVYLKLTGEELSQND